MHTRTTSGKKELGGNNACQSLFRAAVKYTTKLSAQPRIILGTTVSPLSEYLPLTRHLSE